MTDWLLLIVDAATLAILLLLFGVARQLPRSSLRRAVVQFPFFLAAVLGRNLSNAYADTRWHDVLSLIADLLGGLLLINLIAVALFDALLRLLKLRFPDIVRDLSVGVAYLVAGVWLMHRAGVNLASIVATSAVVTAVIGLSLQSTLGSVIGGLALQIDDSINEGDWIELENKTQGLVKKVRWRHTVLETRDWDTLLVPNSQLLNQTIKILGKREGEPRQHRMWVHFSVDFRFAPSEVIGCVDTALQAAPLPGVALEPKPHAICFDLARDGKDSVAYYAVRYWLTDLARDDPASSAVRERIFAALKRAQIPLAVPAATLFVANETEATREHKLERRKHRAFVALRSVELFTALSDQELTELASTVKVAPFARGELITRQGAQAHWLYVLVSGKVEVRVNKNGSEVHVAHLEAPNFFGEMALMTGAAREATVSASTDVECLRVDREDFSALLKRRPEIASEISSVLATRRVALQGVLDGAGSSHADKVQGERGRILLSIKEFFSLGS